MSGPRPRILVVDDEPAARHAAARALAAGSYDVVGAENGREALLELDRAAVDLVLLDLRMPVLDGHQTLAEIVRRTPSPPVVVVTADSSLRTAIDAVKAGAKDFVAKPYEIDELRHVVARTLRGTALERENEQLRVEVARLSGGALSGGALHGESPAMLEVIDALSRVASSSASVLLTGETGTGKELAARFVHGRSAVSSGPFVPVNCAAIPETLVESELFGHRKGAFTGADRDRLGKVREAHEGTLFLDEIGDMPLPVQAKLLRVLGEGLVEPLGGGKPVPVTVRVISATHRDLPRLAKEGGFREDLLFRLRVVDVLMPPLRARGQDILGLANRFLAGAPRGPLALAEDAEQALLGYGWPGNVRELRNAMERAAIFCKGTVVRREDLPADVRGVSTSKLEPVTRVPDLPSADYGLRNSAGQVRVWDPSIDFATAKERLIEDFERAVLTEALRAHDGNVSHAARALGLFRQNLQQKLKELGIVPVRTSPRPQRS